MRMSTLAVALIALAAPECGLRAEEIRTYAKAAAYEDVKFDLVNAIESRGLAVEFNGHLDKMLDRTGPDVGSTKEIYARAEFFTFCSAKYSRQMMEADRINIAFCPFVVFMYEAADKPRETIVGYRRPAPHGSEASAKALAEVDGLLDAIVKAAAQ
jgi:uncharacterized protein (DUF302 family)